MKNILFLFAFGISLLGRCAVTITPATLPTPYIKHPYTVQLTAAGGTKPYVYSISSGSLPAGLILTGGSQGLATISGTPTTAGTYTFTVQAVAAVGGTGTKSYTLTVTQLLMNTTQLTSLWCRSVPDCPGIWDTWQSIGTGSTLFPSATYTTGTLIGDTVLFKRSGTVYKTLRSQFENVTGNLTYTVTGSKNETVTGNDTRNVLGGVSHNYTGNATTTGQQNLEFTALGDFNASGTNAVLINSGNTADILADGQININSNNGNVNLTSALGEATISANTNGTFTAGQELTVIASGADLNLTSLALNVDIDAEAGVSIDALNNAITLNAATDFNSQSADVNISSSDDMTVSSGDMLNITSVNTTSITTTGAGNIDIYASGTGYASLTGTSSVSVGALNGTTYLTSNGGGVNGDIVIDADDEIGITSQNGSISVSAVDLITISSATITSTATGLNSVLGNINFDHSINTTAGDAATINNVNAGRFRKDVSGAVFTLTCNRINANSIILLTFASDPGNPNNFISVVAGSGTCDITFENVPVNNTDVNFLIIN